MVVSCCVLTLKFTCGRHSSENLSREYAAEQRTVGWMYARRVQRPLCRIVTKVAEHGAQASPGRIARGAVRVMTVRVAGLSSPSGCGRAAARVERSLKLTTRSRCVCVQAEGLGQELAAHMGGRSVAPRRVAGGRRP